MSAANTTDYLNQILTADVFNTEVPTGLEGARKATIAALNECGHDRAKSLATWVAFVEFLDSVNA
jgi:hypothetical protein